MHREQTNVCLCSYYVLYDVCQYSADSIRDLTVRYRERMQRCVLFFVCALVNYAKERQNTAIYNQKIGGFRKPYIKPIRPYECGGPVI